MKKNYNFKIVVIIFLLTFQYLSAAELRVVKVGAFDSYPLIFKDKDGAIKGLYADLLAEIGQKENIRIQYVFGTWQDGLDRIKTGEELLVNENVLKETLLVNKLAEEKVTNLLAEKELLLQEVHHRIKNNHVIVVIHDNGIGIPESVIFERSTGFGLELVNMLTQQIGGSLSLERIDGTRFVLEFTV